LRGIAQPDAGWSVDRHHLFGVGLRLRGPFLRAGAARQCQRGDACDQPGDQPGKYPCHGASLDGSSRFKPVQANGCTRQIRPLRAFCAPVDSIEAGGGNPSSSINRARGTMAGNECHALALPRDFWQDALF
jgi:hypothetical protein